MKKNPTSWSQAEPNFPLNHSFINMHFYTQYRWSIYKMDEATGPKGETVNTTL